MAFVGRFGLPLTLGAELSLAEQTWLAMRAAEGSHVGADDSLEDEWRKALATALACADQSVERAALQTFPLYADDLLESYEEILGIAPAPGATRGARRTTASARWSRKSRADLPTLEDELDALLPVGLTAYHVDCVTSTIPGRRYAPAAGTPAQIVAENVIRPNHASAYVVRILDGTGLVSFTGSYLREVDSLLQDAIPAWCLYVLLSTTGPFYLGVSGLGLVPFGP